MTFAEMCKSRFLNNLLIFLINGATPLIILPLVIFKLELSEFYIFAKYNYYLLFCATIFNFNLDVVGSQAISTSPDDRQHVSDVLNEIFMLKLISYVIGGVAFFIFVKSFMKDVSELGLTLPILISLIAMCFNQGWFLNSIKQTFQLTIIEVINKTILIGFAVFILDENMNYLSYIWASVFVTALHSILTLYFLTKSRFSIGVKVLKYHHVKLGSELTVVTLFSSFRNYFFPILVSSHLSASDFSLFALLDRYSKYIISFSSIFTQTVSLDLRQCLEKNAHIYKQRLLRVFFVISGFGILPIVLYFLSSTIFLESITFASINRNALLLVALTILFVFLSDFLSNQILLLFNKVSHNIAASFIGTCVLFSGSWFLSFSAPIIGAPIIEVFSLILIVEIIILIVKLPGSFLCLRSLHSEGKMNVHAFK